MIMIPDIDFDLDDIEKDNYSKQDVIDLFIAYKASLGTTSRIKSLIKDLQEKSEME